MAGINNWVIVNPRDPAAHCCQLGAKIMPPLSPLSYNTNAQLSAIFGVYSDLGMRLTFATLKETPRYPPEPVLLLIT